MTTAEQEFDEYAAARWPRLVRSAVLLGAHAQEAEDVAQTTLTKVWRAWGRVQKADDTDAYVYRILLNAFNDSRRRMWRGEHPTEFIPDRSEPDATDAVVLRDAVWRSLERLKPDHRAVVVLRFYAHLSEAQMAVVLGVAPGTVKSRVARALLALRNDPALVAVNEEVQ
ncbi:SigE family RNA polymerase sigma factor [Nocardioides yefusunii]|uniref:SigE family RNA polymerase sigma factor n=1 Tax=Nocardioides yefusunii TaxID=2500546 RepID=A0ABW1QZF5_9ACTN|nr:SigE family RNA polymerase sigma factor [Nocardioides yefusunii]